MKRIVIMAAAWAAFLCPAHAQIPGQFPAGALYGNPTGAQAPPRAALPGDFGIQLASVTTPITPTPAIGTILAGASYTSTCIAATGNDRIDFAATLNQSGTLKINRYLTVTAGACSNAVPGGPVITAATPAVPALVSASDGAAYRGYTVQIDNTTGVSMTVTNSVLLQTTSSSTTGSPAYTDVLGNQTQPVTPICNNAACSMANPFYTAEVNSVQAGEFHIGETGQNQTVVSVGLTLTGPVPPTIVYAAGSSIGGKITLTGMARVADVAGSSGTSGQILSTKLSFRETAGTSPIDVFYFSADPNTAGTVCVDNTTFTLNTIDGAKLIGIARLTDVTVTPGGSAAAGSTFYQLGGFPMPYTMSSTTSGFACVVARGPVSVTTNTGAINLRVNVLRQ